MLPVLALLATMTPPPGTVVGDPEIRPGSDCAAVDGRFDQATGVYALTFSDFAVASFGTMPAQAKTCDLTVPVTLPPGWRLEIDGVLLAGSQAAGGGGTTGICTAYNLSPLRASWKDDVGPNWPKYNVGLRAGTYDDMDPNPRDLNFVPVRATGLRQPISNFDLLVEDPPAYHRASDCGGLVNVQGRLVIMATTRADGDSADVALRRDDAGSANQHLGWGWRFVPCSDAPVAGAWELSWRDLDRLDRTTLLQVGQDRGGASDASLVLDEVKQEGPLVTGTLRYTAHGRTQGGWYRVTLSEAQGAGTFQGEWGLGTDQGKHVVSAWSGRKLSQ